MLACVWSLLESTAALNWLQNVDQFIRSPSNFGRVIFGSCTGLGRTGAGVVVMIVVVEGDFLSSEERMISLELK